MEQELNTTQQTIFFKTVNHRLKMEKKMNFKFKLRFLITVFMGGLFTLGARAAAPLFCSSHFDDADWTYHLAVAGTFTTFCSSANFNLAKGAIGKSNGDGYKVTIRGYGPGFEMSAFNAVMIHCPLVRKSKLMDADFYGVDVKAGFVAGGHVGVFASKRLGVCMVTGFDLMDIGASIEGARLHFE